MKLFTTMPEYPHTRLHCELDTGSYQGSFWIGSWDTILLRWHPTPRSRFPETVKAINDQADGINYKLCYNCYGLKTLRVHPKVRRGSQEFDQPFFKEIRCPVCKGRGVLQPFQQQERLAL